MAENHVLLETIHLSQNAASITFDNIPQTGYTDLKVVMSMRSTGNLGAPNTYFDISTVSINGSTNISQQQLYGNGTNVFAGTGSTLQIHCVGSGATADTFGVAEMYIPNFTSSSNKAISVNLVTENVGTSAINMIVAGLYSSSSAITSIGLSAYSGSFASGSTFSLYGIATVGTTPAIGPFALGGNIVANDGTYWYHAFVSSGTFTPQKALTCDVLTIAGGGSGGNNASGGGGAGGLLYSSAQSVASATNYTVTIGAGGANQTTYSSNGFNGSNSTFAGSGFTTLTAIGGGGGQGPTSTPGGSGGSGGGAAGYGSGVQGTGTAGQGNNGGTATPPGESGGGGGAGAAGGNGGNDSARNGVGGAGVNTYSAWASATNTGVSGYYAGGGGGGSGQSTSAGTAGGAGGGGTGAGVNQNTLATAGIRNTGSGGGGTGYGNISGSSNTGGGSGIVIIRYAMV